MSGVTTSSLSLAWSLRNWVILDYEEPNGQMKRPWAPFLLFSFFFQGSGRVSPRNTFRRFLSFYLMVVSWHYIIIFFLCVSYFLNNKTHSPVSSLEHQSFGFLSFCAPNEGYWAQETRIHPSARDFPNSHKIWDQELTGTNKDKRKVSSCNVETLTMER